MIDTGVTIHGQRQARFRCHCGKYFVTLIQLVKRKQTKSCGCYLVGAKPKLSIEQRVSIYKKIWNEGKTLREVAEEYNVTTTTIFQIKIANNAKKT